MITIQSKWEKTAGYKTKTGAVLLAAYMLIDAVAPNLMTGQTEHIARTGIDFLIITGVADWAWRERKEIVNKLINIFKKHSKN
jgi:hypothetical protein